MGVVAAAKQHHHRQEEIAGENRHRDAAGQARGLCRRTASEMRILEFGHDDRMARGPRPAGQSFVEAEAHPSAGRSKFAERPVEPVAEFELRAILGRNPDFCDPNEGLHPGLRSVGARTDRKNALSISAHEAPTPPKLLR
jgi:hypothetical protein